MFLSVLLLPIVMWKCYVFNYSFALLIILIYAKFDCAVENHEKHALQDMKNDCHQRLSDSSRVHQFRFRPGLRPGPRWGSLQRSPRPPSWFEGVLLLRGEGKGKGRGEGEGRGGEGGGRGEGKYNTPLHQFLRTPLPASLDSRPRLARSFVSGYSGV